MDAIHQLLAYASAAAAIAGLVWAGILVATGRAGDARFTQAQAAVVSVFLVTAVSGALLLLAGSRPADGLHLLYALVALAIIPLARSSLGRRHDRGAAVLLLVAFIVLGALTYRLFTTG